MPQPFGFMFSESCMAQLAGVALHDTHFDADAIFKVYDRIRPLADELGVPAPKPRLAGFAYSHLAALGARIVFAEDGEPNVEPMIHAPEDIDRLRPPSDYLAVPLVKNRLRLAAELGRRNPEALGTYIGHYNEGPLTTAGLLIGPDFFTLLYDDPARAHKLLQFSTETALQFGRALHRHWFGDAPAKTRGLADDFAGMLPPAMFSEFVVPYWNMYYEGQPAGPRSLHSELLREDHLPYLGAAQIAAFDPGADQYLAPELLQSKCSCPFKILIKTWEVNNMTAGELERFYRRIAACRPQHIRFVLDAMEQLEKIKRLLQVARELAAA